MNWRPIAEMPEEWMDRRMVLLGSRDSGVYAVCRYGDPYPLWIDAAKRMYEPEEFTHYAADFEPIPPVVEITTHSDDERVFRDGATGAIRAESLQRPAPPSGGSGVPRGVHSVEFSIPPPAAMIAAMRADLDKLLSGQPVQTLTEAEKCTRPSVEPVQLVRALHLALTKSMDEIGRPWTEEPHHADWRWELIAEAKAWLAANPGVDAAPSTPGPCAPACPPRR
jgi:hypothetical protein